MTAKEDTEEEYDGIDDYISELRLENKILRGMLVEEQKKVRALLYVVPDRQKISIDKLKIMPPYGLAFEDGNGGITVVVRERDIPADPPRGSEFELE
jgi:hypothetical protein